MNSSDAVSEMTDAERDSEIPSAVTSVMETLAPSAARGVKSSNFAAVSSAVSLYRAFKSFRKGDRKRGLLRAGVGLFWVGVVLAQRRRKKRSAGSDASNVTDAGSDLEDAIDPGERETDHATGSEVVNTTDADIDESDTAPEVETSAEIGREASEDVDQRDVMGSDEVEAVSESDEDDETAVGEMGTETADDETDVPESQSEIETVSEGEASETSTENADSESAE
jgi:hypothetical protein